MMDLFPRNRSAIGRSREQFHVLMFPWLAQGHFSAYAGLSKRLADQGIKVFFVSTPRNIPKIKPMLGNHVNIQLVELQLPDVEGLPKGIECTSDVPAHLWRLLVKAVHLLEKPFESLLHRERPDCIIFDLVQYWTPKVAAKFGIPTVFFLTFGAAYCSYEFSPHRAKYPEKITAEELTNPPPGYPSPAISWRPFEALFSLKTYYDNSNGGRGIDRMMSCIDGCHSIALKSCNELEGKFIEYFERVTMKPVLYVGPLLSPTKTPLQEGSCEVGDSSCLQWLEKQAPGSVVYVAFGSECFLSEQQTHELLLGLEAAQQRFIVALKSPKNASVSLAEDFGGLILRGWAPQREILSHASTGAFFTHCGWNSVMEGMSNGLPLIAMPLQWDQGLNARLIVHEFKVGVEVERQDHGFAGREEICKAVRRIMVEEEGKDIKQRAAEMGNRLRTSILNESQKVCIDKFIDHILALV